MGVSIFVSNMYNWKKSPLALKNEKTKELSENHIFARLALVSMYKALAYSLVPLIPAMIMFMDVKSTNEQIATRHFIPCSTHNPYESND